MNMECYSNSQQRLCELGRPVLEQVEWESDSFRREVKRSVSVYEFIKKPINLRLKEGIKDIFSKSKIK